LEYIWVFNERWRFSRDACRSVCKNCLLYFFKGGAIYRGSGGHMGCVSGAAVAVEGRFITVQELKRKQVDGYSDRILIIKDGSGKVF
jgi:hypothetical protein